MRKRQILIGLVSLLILILSFSLGIQKTEAAPLAGANADPDKVWFDDNGVFTDETADAWSATANDVKLAEIAGQDAHYVGMNYVFDEIIYNIGTAGNATGSVAWQYWNGTSWASLTGPSTSTFNTAGTQIVSFTIPLGWTTTTVNGVTAYYIRATTSDSYLVTVPLATQISVQEYNLKVKVQDELNTVITGLTSSAFTITGAPTTTIYAFREIGSGVYELALYATGTDTNYDYTAEKDGYVTSAAAATGNLSTTLTDLTVTPASLNFAHKVTGQDELGNSLTGATVTVGGTSCTESSGVYYCATPLANDGGTDDVIVTLDGYVTWTANSIDRTANSDVQATYTSASQFAYKITSITTEGPTTNITASVTAISVGDDTGKNICTLSGGVGYCPVVLANSNGTMVGNVTLDGYVQKDYSLVTGTNRTANTDSQVSDTIVNILFGHKITITMVNNGPISGATVTAGDSYSVTCSEQGVTGVYYCAIPISHTDTLVKIVKSGYSTETFSYTDRTAHTDSQVTLSVNLRGVVAPLLPPAPVEKPIERMTIQELQAKITEIQAKIAALRAQLIQLLQEKIAEIQTKIAQLRAQLP